MEINGLLYGTIGYDPETDLHREAFFTMRTKSGTLMDKLRFDAGILLSLAVQYATRSTALATSVAGLNDGTVDNTIAELVDEIVNKTKSIQ